MNDTPDRDALDAEALARAVGRLKDEEIGRHMDADELERRLDELFREERQQETQR